MPSTGFTPPPSPPPKKPASPKYRLKKGRVLQAVFKEIKDDVVHGTGSIVKATKSLSARNVFKHSHDPPSAPEERHDEKASSTRSV